MQAIALDAAGHRRSPATMPGYHQGRPPRNKGLRYPVDPPTIEEIVAVMHTAGDRPAGSGCAPGERFPARAVMPLAVDETERGHRRESSTTHAPRPVLRMMPRMTTLRPGQSPPPVRMT